MARGLFSDEELAEYIDVEPTDRDTLVGRWIVPPFSVLDSRQSYWQKRKKLWLKLGIKSELGRGETLTYAIDADGRSTSDPDTAWTDRGKRKISRLSPGGSPRPACNYKNRERGDGAGRPLARTYGQDLMRGENTKFAKSQPKINSIYKRADDAGGTESATGTSIFDPVLCEITYQWFCPSGGAILDPFCGGSVRGIVASITGRNYTGIDLSERQIEANRQQAHIICPSNPPTWIVGDAAAVRGLADGPYDLIFSCPPYHDLEVYSDDPQDLSTMTWAQFLESYRHIIKECCRMLRPHRFAVFVVGDVRDSKTGHYRNLTGETITAFVDAGLHLYNHANLLNALGSLPIRAHKQMVASRKLGKGHQDVLVFVKGSWRKAVATLDGERINGTYI